MKRFSKKLLSVFIALLMAVPSFVCGIIPAQAKLISEMDNEIWSNVQYDTSIDFTSDSYYDSMNVSAYDLSDDGSYSYGSGHTIRSIDDSINNQRWVVSGGQSNKYATNNVGGHLDLWKGFIVYNDSWRGSNRAKIFQNGKDFRIDMSFCINPSDSSGNSNVFALGSGVRYDNASAGSNYSSLGLDDILAIKKDGNILVKGQSIVDIGDFTNSSTVIATITIQYSYSGHRLAVIYDCNGNHLYTIQNDIYIEPSEIRSFTAGRSTDNSQANMFITAIDFYIPSDSGTVKNEDKISRDNLENTTTDSVKVNNVIYTKGENETQYGLNVSADDSYNTPIELSSGIESVRCLEDAGASLKVENGRLSGSFSDSAYKALEEDKEIYATLEFTLSGGIKEYHKVAVKTVPVKAHIASDSQGTSVNVSYLLTFEGSTGTKGDGVFNYLGNPADFKENHNFVNGQAFTINSNTKQAGSWGANTRGDGGWPNTDNVTATNYSYPTATYYIDKSDTSLANGSLWHGDNYIIPLNVQRLKNWNNGLPGQSYSANINVKPASGNLSYAGSSKNSAATSFDFTDTADTINYYEYTNNVSIDESSVADSPTNRQGVYNIRLVQGGNKTSKYVNYFSVQTANLVVNLFDKQYLRNTYNNCIANIASEKGSNSSEYYTVSSWETYYKALLAAEAYLSNYQLTDTDSQYYYNLQSNLDNAYNNLTRRAVLEQYTQLRDLVEKAQEKITSDNYTASSVSTLQTVLDNLVLYYEKTDEEKKDTAYIDVQNAIDTIAAAIEEPPLIQKANFTALEEAYNKADKLLLSLQDMDNAVYSLADIQLLASYVLNGANVLAVDKENMPNSTYQSAVDNAAKSINDCLAALKSIDTSALIAAINTAENYDRDIYQSSVVDEAKAQADSVFTTYEYGDKILHVLKVFDQDNVDNTTDTLIGKMNEARVVYTITAPENVDVSIGSGTITPLGGGKYEIAYGTTVTFRANDGNKDTAWYMRYTSNVTTREEQYQASGAVYTMQVFGNITVRTEQKTDESTYKLTVARKYDQGNTNAPIECVTYVPAGTAVALDYAKDIPYYVFSNYTDQDGNVITGSYTVEKDSIIYVNYVYDESSVKYDVKATALTGGTAIDTCAAYNSRVELKGGDGAYAWVELIKNSAEETWRPFYIGADVTFYVSESVTLKAVTEAEFIEMFKTKDVYVPNLRQDLSMIDTNNTAKRIFNGQYVVPSGADIMEYGILLNKNAAAVSDPANDLILENIGLIDGANMVRAKSTKHTSANQFAISVSGLTDAGTSFQYRGYIIYKDASGKISTVYSDVITEIN